MEKELFIRIAEIQEQHWWFVARRKLIEAFICDLPKGMTILDVGAGTGSNFPIFCEAGKVVGLEPSIEAREIAREKGLNYIVAGEAEKIPFPDESFHLLAALDVLEHLPDDMKALREFYRVLKNDGCLLITVPAFPFLWSKHDDLNKHFRRYFKGELVRKVENCGFKVEKASYFFFFIFPFFAGLRLLSKLVSKIFQDFSRYEFKIPPAPINNFLITLHVLEVKLLSFFSFPWGSSLILIARK